MPLGFFSSKIGKKGTRHGGVPPSVSLNPDSETLKLFHTIFYLNGTETCTDEMDTVDAPKPYCDKGHTPDITVHSFGFFFF